MLQYLLNTTAIWLLSIVVYDILLKKETCFKYNRAYLTGTLMMGIIVPAIEWQQQVTSYNVPLQQQVWRLTAAATQAANTKTIIAPAGFDYTFWTKVVYVAGIVLMSILVLIDVLKLTHYYRRGIKTRKDGWMLIETNKAHTPFSIMGLLFVKSRNEYTNSEWQMILDHENQHRKKVHFADLILIEFAKIIFWFHPLIYVISRRILLVHEYQADSAIIQTQSTYSRFLIEQAMMHSAPTITHALGKSPIKRRIEMINRSSSSASKLKNLVLLPVVAVSFLCFAKKATNDVPVKTGNTCKWRGNTIVFKAPKKPDSYMRRDEQSGQLVKTPIGWPTPALTLNGERIYEQGADEQVVIPGALNNNDGLVQYLHKNAKSAFEKLQDGNYIILLNDVVIDKEGKIAYYEYSGLINAELADKFPLKKETDMAIANLILNAPKYSPATKNNLPVPYLISYPYERAANKDYQYIFTVKKHKVIADATTQN
jgi:hypothetical protein